MSSLIPLLSIISQLLSFLFIARFIAQILDQSGGNPITRLLLDITDPILAPVRRIMPSTGMLDFSPMVVLILLQVLQRVLASYAY
jgi:YggT family protein